MFTDKLFTEGVSMSDSNNSDNSTNSNGFLKGILKTEVTRKSLVDVAMGRLPADRVIKNGKLIDVYTGKIRRADIAIKGERIALVSNPDKKRDSGVEHTIGDSTEIIDASGYYLSPGLMDSHIHIEASMVSPEQFARAVVPKGNTAVNWETLWAANVLGVRGLRMLLEHCNRTPLKYFLTATSGVPCASTELVTANEYFEIEDIEELLSWPQVVGLGEVVTFNEVVQGREREFRQIERALAMGKTVDGSAPGFTGKELNAYAAAGVMSEHEAITPEQALEKLQMGMRLVIREGSSMRNVFDLLKVISDYKVDTRHCLFCVDDKDIREIEKEGLIDDLVRKAISAGIDPVTAVQMGSLNPAEYFRLDRDLGGIAPGKIADILFIDDLDSFSVKRVMVNGKIVAENGKLITSIETSPYLGWSLNTVTIKRELGENDFIFKTDKKDEVKVRVIKVLGHQIVSYEEEATLKVANGAIQPDPSRDILKLVVIERYGKTAPNIARGFVKGFGIKDGAIATTISPDIHQIITVGDNDRDLYSAVNRLIAIQGGVVVTSGGKVMEELQLPIGGLMTSIPYEKAIEKLDSISSAASKLGCKIPSPLMTLAFAGCPTLVEFKLSDKGLIRVTEGKLVPLEV